MMILFPVDYNAAKAKTEADKLGLELICYYVRDPESDGRNYNFLCYAGMPKS
jgi:hypothetical protein